MNIHERARQLTMDARIDELNAADQQWLESHMAECADCEQFNAALDGAIGMLRLPAVMASRSLVSAT